MSDSTGNTGLVLLKADGSPMQRTEGEPLVFPPVKLRKLHRRDVPKEWEERLREISPPTDRFSWLKLVWEPGHPWESPVDRFFIYQMVPERAVEEGILEQLRDYPPPSEMGNRFDPYMVNEETGQMGKFVNNPDCLITERAWHLYRETKCWGRPFWVIQGNGGGHKRWFSPVEQKFLKLAGLPQDPPVPGSLPYADFDDRVMARLREHDMLLGHQAPLRRKKSLLSGIKNERYEQEEERFRTELVKWLANQVTEAGEGVMESLMALDAPRADIDVKEMEKREEQATENFIRTGKSHGGLILVD
jgi:hypothetical protein